MTSIIDAELVQENKGIQKRAEETRKGIDQDRKLKPLTYDDIKDDPYYYYTPYEADVDD